MAEPETDRGDVDEAQETLGGLVVTCRDAAGVLQLVETPLDEVAQPVEGAIDGDAQLACLAHRDHRRDMPLPSFTLAELSVDLPETAP